MSSLLIRLDIREANAIFLATLNYVKEEKREKKTADCSAVFGYAKMPKPHAMLCRRCLHSGYGV